MSKTIGIIFQVALIVVAIISQQYYLAGALAIGLVGTLLTKTPQPPTPKAGDIKLNSKQARPPRVRGYGEDRLYGYWLLRETKDGTLYDLRALHHGEIDGFGAIYLHDEIVTIGEDDLGKPDSVIAPSHFTTNWSEDGIYASYIQVVLRPGTVPEVAMPLFTANLDIWTAAHRGDGIAKIGLRCESAGPERLNQIYPNLAPEPSVVTRMSRVFDPRDEAQSRATPATWTWTQNNALALADYIAHPDGFRFSWERRIAPALDEWITAADVCVEQIPLKAGGFEDRYHFDGIYYLTERPADVLPRLLTTMDGWLYLRPDGALGIKAGKFEAPTVTIAAKHILNSQIRRNRKNEDVINEILASFTSVPHDYGEQPLPAWRDEADIASRGITKSKPIDLTNVKQFGQGRRLMKRAMARFKAEYRGTFTTDAYGVVARGHRYLTIDLSPRGYGLRIVEVMGYRESLWPPGATIDWIDADVNIDAWDPATEEGERPPVPVRESTEDKLTLPRPTITSVTSVTYDAGGGAINVQFAVTIVDTGSPNQLEVQYKPLGTRFWQIERVSADATDGTDYVHLTAPVTDDQVYLFQARYINAGGVRGRWGPIEPIRATADASVPVQRRRVTSAGALRVTSSGAERVNP